MGRSARVAFPGAKYHTMARGNWRANIFAAPADYTRFLMQLRDAAQNEAVIVYAYVLMTNHYHLFIETPRGNVSRFMQRLNTAYSLYFRGRTQKPGHCFQGRYACQLVTGDEYCLRLTRYIHLNPVKTSRFESASKAEKLAALNRYEWSSYPGYIDPARAQDWVDYRWLSLDCFQSPHASPASETQRQAYAQYIESFLDGRDDIIREDHDTGRLLDNAPIGADRCLDWKSPVGARRAETGVFHGQTPNAKVSGLDKDAQRLFHGLTPGSKVSGLDKDAPNAKVSGLDKDARRLFHGLTPTPDRQDRCQAIENSGLAPDFSRPDTSTSTSAEPTPETVIPFDQITRAAAKAFGLRESDLFAHGLHAALAKATAVELACRHTGLKQYEVAERFGYKSESSVGKLRKRLREQIESNPAALARFKKAKELCMK